VSLHFQVDSSQNEIDTEISGVSPYNFSPARENDSCTCGMSAFNVFFWIQAQLARRSQFVSQSGLLKLGRIGAHVAGMMSLKQK
jgi:hypothetical protein